LQDENRKVLQLLSDESREAKEASKTTDTSANQQKTKKMKEELKKIMIKYNVLANVLQGLLLESNVDWANDPHFLEVMLKLQHSDE
ncbi:hypothetical protein BX616_006281, partial [Lobosporangium transversale]